MKTRLLRLTLWFLTIGMMVIIFLFSAQNGENSMALSGRFSVPIANFIASMQKDVTPEKYQEILNAVQFFVRKTAHFSEYAVLGFLIRLLMWSYSVKRAGGWAWLAGTLYAGTDEIHQLLTGERSGMWQDVVLDSCGAVFGVVMAGVFMWLLGRRKARNVHE